MTNERRRRRRGGSRRPPRASDAAERSGSATSSWYRAGSLAKGSNPIPFLGLGLTLWICWPLAVRLDPLLKSRARTWYAAPSDPFGQWVDVWIAGPRYPTYRVISRLLIVGPVLLGIAYELWQRRMGRARKGAARRHGLVAGGVPPSESRVPARWPWIALAIVVIFLAVVSGRNETNPRSPGLWIGLVFLGSLWIGNWMAGRPSHAQPHDGDARTEWDTEANP